MNYRDKPSFGQLSASECLILPTYTVATLPSTLPTGAIVYCSDGNAGQESLALYNGSAWIALATGATAATA
jgi:hypothetical protein